MTIVGLAQGNAAGALDRLRPSIVAAQRGDKTAFKPLYEEYARSVYNLVFRCVRNPQAAEDVCQEIWVKAFRELPKLQDPQAFPAWLYRIAARASIDAARKDQRLPATTELPEERLSIADGDPEVTALRREKVRLTWEAMATMPARQHVALYLREIQNMSYKEIAQMLGTSQSAVEMLLFRARQGFAKAYERLESAGPDRCQNARRSMSAVLDGEGTRVQQNAIRAHADACLPCSGELAQMRRASAAFSALLPLPVPALLSQRIFESVGAAGAGAAAGSGATVAPASIAKIVALAAAKAKIAGIALVATVVTTASTVGAMNSPLAEEIRPGVTTVQHPSHPIEFSAPPLPEVEISHNPVASNSETSQAPLSNEQQLAPPVIDPNLVPSTLRSVDDLTAPVSATVDQATSDVGQTVDSIMHEVEAIAAGLPAVPPVDTSALPELPIATPPVVPALLP